MKKIEPLKSEYIECCCHWTPHLLQFILEPNEGDLWVEIHLNPKQSFFRRLWLGIKYIFGFVTCSYGHFDTWELLSSEDSVDKLDSVLSIFKQARKAFAKCNEERREAIKIGLRGPELVQNFKLNKGSK